MVAKCPMSVSLGLTVVEARRVPVLGPEADIVALRQAGAAIIIGQTVDDDRRIRRELIPQGEGRVDVGRRSREIQGG